MAVKSTDILSNEDMAQTLENRTEDLHQFRRAFRSHDATDIDSDSFTFPEHDDELDEDDFGEVEELAEYPHASFSTDGTTVQYTKYGFQVPISDEAVSDSKLPLRLDEFGDMARAEESKLDSVAWALMSDNLNGAGPVSSTDGVFETLVDGYVEMVNQGFDAGSFEVYHSPYSWGEAAKDDTFNRATDQGDALARNGQLGNMFGMDHVLSNTGDLAVNEAILVDTSRYGYESTRWETQISSSRDEDVDADVWKIRTRKGFAVTNADAALKLEFPSS